ncbi:GNAT family N-acetyltransferase [Cohnella suwonensis]|uniref:GNAT family N-acetyltransferase n=1 Tax=Cohnella suwonensis TaxID=696072 RepID=A0ABW0LWI0_9BACL
MLKSFGLGDRIFERASFIADEVSYNLVFRICDSPQAVSLKSEDDTLLWAWTAPHHAWLWMDGGVAEKRRDALFREVIASIDGELPGINGKPAVAELFARLFASAKGLVYREHMRLEAYECPAARKPTGVEGRIRQARIADMMTVATFMAGFSEGAYGVAVTPESQLSGAEGLIANGDLYFWLEDDGTPVSMANIAHRSAKHARINAVYTPIEYRRRGYAGAVVAALCGRLEKERLMPMLYADLANPASNQAYRNVGFVERGWIAEYKFIS